MTAWQEPPPFIQQRARHLAMLAAMSTERCEVLACGI